MTLCILSNVALILLRGRRRGGGGGGGGGERVGCFTLIIRKNDISSLSCAGAILKNRPVCYGTSRLKSRVCAVTRYALLKTPTLKSNKH